MAVRYVKLSPKDAYEKISDGLTGRFFSSEEVTSHITRLPNGESSIVGVFEKYSWRNSNRMTMTVLCSPTGKLCCEVFFAAAGAGNGFFGFDWGAAESFEKALLSSIEDDLCSDPFE